MVAIEKTNPVAQLISTSVKMVTEPWATIISQERSIRS